MIFISLSQAIASNRFRYNQSVHPTLNVLGKIGDLNKQGSLSSHRVLHSSQVTFDNILNFYPYLELRERMLEQQNLSCKII
jgi:hypothetical protein